MLNAKSLNPESPVKLLINILLFFMYLIRLYIYTSFDVFYVANMPKKT